MFVSRSTNVFAFSIFSGLIVAQGEQGVKVVEVHPGCPGERAGLRVGDLIMEVDGQKVKTLEEFANMSKAMKDKNIESNLLVIRKSKLENVLLTNYSDNVFKEWKEKVPLPPERGEIIGGVSLFQYYVEKGKTKLEENKQGGPLEAKIARYDEAVRYLFYALHYNPISVEVALLIADTYMNTAKLCLENGRTPLAVENYGKAANLYEKCSKKRVSDKELEQILARLQNVEKELASLLPPEKQEASAGSAEKISTQLPPSKSSP
ncbi:MAG TPA: PDZ domain-containing protein [Candidatus Hypogeohydataceae bacterium YC40]